MTIRIAALAAIALCLPVLQAQTAAKPMTTYYIDTEGGHSTLYISPSGESLLEDTGSPGDRDVDRIMAAITDAGLKQIDYMVLTHYHVDHVGGFSNLVGKIPIKHFVDHGPTVEQREQVANFQATYKEIYDKAGPGGHIIVKPGDKIPITGMSAIVVTAGGEVLKKPIAGAPGAGKPNPDCATYQKAPPNRDPENAQSVGIVYTYGKFRSINFGDFVDHEGELMCPNNPIGTVDVYITPNHGLEPSGPAVLEHGLQPRVVIMHNGNRKGAAISVMKTIFSQPGLEDLWQLHWSYTAGLEYNAPSLFIANLEDPVALGTSLTTPAPPAAAGGGGRGGSGAPGGGGGPAGIGAGGGGGRGGSGAGGRGGGAGGGSGAGGRGGAGGGGRGGGHTGPAFWIKITARPDGSFTVLNSRNDFSKTYAAKK
jgi:competence protein ComEC